MGGGSNSISMEDARGSLLAKLSGPTKESEVQASLPQSDWRVPARIAATLANCGMVLYVYIWHLMGIEWARFGNFRTLAADDLQTVRDYLRTWDLDPVFDHLRLFTFSEAMLENLTVYMIIGTPVAITFFVLELQRTRWLDGVLARALPQNEESRWMRQLLKLYSITFSITLSFILAIGPLHLERPRAHYLCAGLAISCGCVSIMLYLAATRNLKPVLATGDVEAVAWATRTTEWIRPALHCVLALHIFLVISGVWKAETLADDRAALTFGIIETSVVLGYQLFAGVFVFDDVHVHSEKAKLAGSESADGANKENTDDEAEFILSQRVDEKLAGL